MRYFIDTEFLESGWGEPIWLLSLGVVAEDGRELYVVWNGCPVHLANDWVKLNVLPHVNVADGVTREQIRQAVLGFVGADKDPSFIGDYAAYDWVVFCSIFGTMTDLPAGWPMYIRDLKMWSDMLGGYDAPGDSAVPHHALEDARQHRRKWDLLRSLVANGQKNTAVL